MCTRVSVPTGVMTQAHGMDDATDAVMGVMTHDMDDGVMMPG